jgi:hypothetical protein
MALTVTWIFGFGEHLRLTIPCLTRLNHHLSIYLLNPPTLMPVCLLTCREIG